MGSKPFAVCELCAVTRCHGRHDVLVSGLLLGGKVRQPTNSRTHEGRWVV